MNAGARIVFAKNLNSYLKKAGKNQSDLQEYIGCSASTVSDWCKGNKYPRPDKMQRISEFFGVLMSDLVNDRDHRLPNGAYEIDISKMTKIPILGVVRAGHSMCAEEILEGYTTYDKSVTGERYFALRVKGDSMNAAGINEGDVVIVRKQPIVDQNEIAVVCVNGDEATIKRYTSHGNTVFLTPQSYNPEHQVQIYDMEESPVFILGRVMRVQHDF